MSSDLNIHIRTTDVLTSPTDTIFLLLFNSLKSRAPSQHISYTITCLYMYINMGRPNRDCRLLEVTL